jgi:hypothetical protein
MRTVLKAWGSPHGRLRLLSVRAFSWPTPFPYLWTVSGEESLYAGTGPWLNMDQLNESIEHVRKEAAKAMK